MYYLKKKNNNEGYVIVDTSGANVLEFSSGIPAYDTAAETLNIENSSSVKYLYVNAMPAIVNEDTYLNLNLLGEVKETVGIGSDVIPFYNPNPQSGNCIAGAISNLLWFWGGNGYSALTSNMSFKDVENKVDSLINAEGGYANKNISNTIKKYVKNKSSSYSVSVNNKWNPSFSNVKSETNSRPCLLGFADGSPYSKNEGHMTVCVGTRSAKSGQFCKLIDGWSSQVVEKQWGSYNDFMSKVGMSK